MGKKSRNNKNNRQGVVYSTNPDYDYDYFEEDEQETLPAKEQNLYVLLDKKNRGGKKVTLIEGFVGTSDDLKALGKALKSHCGVGGNTKDGDILIQGDFRQKILDYLKQKGYGVKAKGW